jgi:hypothetical protein
MRGRFEFCFHTLAELSAEIGEVDPTLAMLGTQGWEIRAVAPAAGGGLVVAMQRPLDEEIPLADGPSLAAKMAEPLAAPTIEVLEREPHRGEEAADIRGRG